MVVQPIGSVAEAAPTTEIFTLKGAGVDFVEMLGEGVAKADRSLQTADARLRELAAGEDVAIHEVMIAMERARADLTLVVEVRNRVLEGYQELMRMQL